jgi:hypothetical protein
MAKFDGQMIAQQMLDAVRTYVARSISGLLPRIYALENAVKTVPTKGEQGPPGESIKGEPGVAGAPGRDAEPVNIGEIVAKVVAALPEPVAGKDAHIVDVAAIVAEVTAKIPTPVPGKDGASIDPVMVRAMVGEEVVRAVAAIPAAKPGRDGRDVDPALLNDAIDRKVADAVSKLPMPKDGAPGEAGIAGKDADPALIATMIAEGVAKALPGAAQRAVEALMPDIIAKAAEAVPRPLDGKDAPAVDTAAIVREVLAMIPVPRDGTNGRDGRDAAGVLDIDAAVARAVALLPAPKDGRDADPVDMGAIVMKAVALIPVPRDGVNGNDAPVVDESALAERVRSMIPIPRDGKDAPAVDVDAIVETVTKRLPVVKDGADGHSVTLDDVRPILEAETARWQLEFERRATDVMHAAIEKVIEKIPVPQNGVDGKDAAQLDTFDASLDGRILKLSLAAGDRVISKDIRLPIPFDKGVFRSGEKYEQSDVVTFGGSQWIALCDTVTKPPSNDWRLCVKKGADGKS